MQQSQILILKRKKEQPKEKKPKEAKKPKDDKKKKEKSKKTTSCMDMPIIDILIPKSVKTTKKETDIVKKDNPNAEDKAVDKTKSLTEASPLQVKIDHGDLFKGLDPDSITETEKYPTSSPTQKGTVKVEDIKKEETTTIAAKETIKLKEETKKVEVEKPAKVKAEKEIQIATIDIPTVI